MIQGPPFYDPDDWEPDAPTIGDLFSHLVYFSAAAKGVRGSHLVMTPALEHALRSHFRQMGERGAAAMQAFFDGMKPIANKMAATVNEAARTAEAVQYKPPKNGPQFNQHARHGKGGRRR